jgi:hypothetical protein
MIIRHEISWCAFHGRTGGSGPLSWAQAACWRLFSAAVNFRPISFFVKVPARRNLDKESAVACIAQLVEQNPTLRTRILIDAESVNYQEILQSGTIPVHIVEISEWKAQPAEIWTSLAEVNKAYLVEGLIVIRHGSVRLISMRMNHVITDEWGKELLRAQLNAMLDDGGRGSDTHEGKSSLDLANFELSRAGETAGRQAIDFAVAQLMAAPQTMFPHFPLRAERPRYWNLMLSSKPLLGAIKRIARQRKTTPSIPIIAAFAAIMATRSQLQDAFIYVNSSNRSARAWRDFSGLIVQDVALRVPIRRSSSFGHLVDSIRAPVINAYRYGRFDPKEFQQQTAQIELNRGIRLDKIPYSTTINVRHDSYEAFPKLAKELSSSERTATGTSRILRRPRMEETNTSFYVSANISISQVVLFVKVDTAAVSLAEAEAIMHGIETLLCELELADFPVCDISVMCPGIGRSIGERTHIIDGNLISLERCREILESCPSVHAASVHLSAAENPRLTACLYSAHPGFDLPDFHRALVRRLSPHSLTMAPYVYRIYAAPPAQLDVPTWDDRKLMAMGTGRISQSAVQR